MTLAATYYGANGWLLEFDDSLSYAEDQTLKIIDKQQELFYSGQM